MCRNLIDIGLGSPRPGRLVGKEPVDEPVYIFELHPRLAVELLDVFANLRRYRALVQLPVLWILGQVFLELAQLADGHRVLLVGTAA